MGCSTWLVENIYIAKSDWIIFIVFLMVFVIVYQHTFFCPFFHHTTIYFIISYFCKVNKRIRRFEKLKFVTFSVREKTLEKFSQSVSGNRSSDNKIKLKLIKKLIKYDQNKIMMQFLKLIDSWHFW